MRLGYLKRSQALALEYSNVLFLGQFADRPERTSR
jgi:hypothetical protein